MNNDLIFREIKKIKVKKIRGKTDLAIILKDGRG